MDWNFIAQYWHTILGVGAFMLSTGVILVAVGTIQEKVINHEKEHRDTPYELQSVSLAQHQQVKDKVDCQYRELMASINGLGYQLRDVKKTVDINDAKAEERHLVIIQHLFNDGQINESYRHK
jgi:hypothetical protein